MLTALSIRDVVLIESLDLEFGPGLGVLTGETGAGKSILMDALGLALGARADSALVRRASPGRRSVSFDLPADNPPFRCFATMELEAAQASHWHPAHRQADGGSRA